MNLTGTGTHQADSAGSYTHAAACGMSGGKPVYQHGGEDEFLFFFGSRWQVGTRADLGSNRGWLFVEDCAARPELIQAAWKQFDGKRWRPAPALRVR